MTLPVRVSIVLSDGRFGRIALLSLLSPCTPDLDRHHVGGVIRRLNVCGRLDHRRLIGRDLQTNAWGHRKHATITANVVQRPANNTLSFCKRLRQAFTVWGYIRSRMRRHGSSAKSVGVSRANTVGAD